jgi:nicotinamidase-related amidase
MTLDNKPALLVIDLQKGVVALPAAHPIDEIIQRSASLAAAFRKNGLPVVLVNVDGRAPGRTEAGPSAFSPPADWSQLVAELEPQPGDLEVTKRTWGAFHATDLDAQLHVHGVTQVVLTGVATSAGVESTARAAHEHGYNVVVITDAMTDASAEAHANSVERIFPRLGERATTSEVLERLEAAR